MKVQLFPFILVLLIALISPNISYAQLPNLGTAEDMAIFTKVGALENIGTSDIKGKIGTDNGPISGFGAPTTVNGNIEWQNGVTAQCAIDVQAAYDELFATSPTVLGHAPSFGFGETLSAGVYSIGSAGSVNGSLTLDAAGDADAVFIFQFGGAFNTEPSTNINLINGALECNVFWIADGAIGIAALTDMKGTLICNGAISMGTGAKLTGRLLSIAGAASVSDVLITIPDCVALPIELLSFTGYCDKRNVVLQWSTASESNNSFFTVEQSSDGTNWQIAGKVTGAGNSSSILNYTLTDIALNEETTYYRLKQTDFNGKYKYSAIIYIHKCGDNGANLFSIYPNPSEGKFELHFNGNPSEISSIHIFNSQSQKVYSSIGFQSSFDLSNTVSGIYFMHIQQNSEIKVLKFVAFN